MKRILQEMTNRAINLNQENILMLCEKNVEAKILDLGCDDGVWTKCVSNKIGSKDIFGIDVEVENLLKAKKRGIKTVKSDLNSKFPFKDSSFDVIHANQVIEHISSLDNFISEIHRVLKSGGYVVISTENGSSWHNIFASIMGWQIFSLTNVSSKKLGVGNPISLHGGENISNASWTHKTIFNYLGLKEIFLAHGFSDVIITGAGYYPFPAILGRFDVRHSHFITLKAYKK